MASELSRATAFLAPTVGVVLLELSYGAGGPFVPLVFVLAALPVVLASLVVGRLVGDTLRFLNATVSISLWVKAALFVVVTVLAFVGTQLFLLSRFGASDELGSASAALSIPAFLPGKPLQSYAGVALAPLGAAGGPARGALGPLVGTVLIAVIPVGLAGAIRLETRLLGRDERPSAGGAARSRGVPGLLASFPAGRVGWRYLLRTRRDPRTLAHLSPVLFGGLAMSASFVRDPALVFVGGPPIAVVGGSILAGAAYCLNPLGDDVEQLPLLLTSTASTGVLLRGRALAGVALGLVVAVGIGAPLGLVERSVLFVVWQTLLACVLAVAGTGVALGVGALVPRFERREYMSVERPHPSNYAIAGFAFGGMIVGGLGYALVLVTTGDTPGFLVAGAWAVYLAVVAVPGFAGYRYAVGTFDDLTLDDV